MELLAVLQHPVGGIRTYLKYVYGRLPAAKYAFTILTTETPDPGLTEADFVEHKVNFLRAPARRGFTGLLGLLIRALASGRYDVVHSHGLTAATATTLANLGSGLPHVVTPHRLLWPEDFQPPWGRGKRHVLSKLLGRADVIQLVGREAQENLFANLHKLSGRCETVVILNGIDIDRFNGDPLPSGASWRDRWAVPPDVFLFGFLGRMMPVKGFDYLAEAVRILAAEPEFHTRFQIAVVTDGAFTREQRACVERAGLSQFFRFVGFIPDVASVLAELDAVVIPSLSEACSLLAMETLVSGCPLIASRCSGIRELIEGSPAVGVLPADGGALAGAMATMMENRSTAKQAALAFVPAARVRFDSRRVAGELDALLDRLLSRRGARVRSVW